LSESAAQTLERAKPVWPTARVEPGRLKWLEARKILYVVMVPVLGKKSAVVCWFWGSTRSKQLTSEELDFWQPAAATWNRD